ncbi:agamous-like MADS-box protein AGL92 [Argentina anserina]|uniref:agamous-like MADS-box protein AGL92 n=1 Tax=Argentina anserina TaxID=57926 RepID=UPI002176575A|nr:agamous-like MADS-box protein AGL92 [Potentilla anserina]
MARRKVKLQFIVNNSNRKSSYMKRKAGFMKKMEEISILCDVKTAAVIYSPYEREPVVFPNHEAATKLLNEYLNMPDMDRFKNMVDQEMYLKQRIAKGREQIRKLKIDIREKEMSDIIFKCLDQRETDNNLSQLELKDLHDLTLCIERYHREVKMKLENARERNRVATQSAGTEDISELTSIIERQIREVNIGKQIAHEHYQMEAQPAAVELGPVMFSAFGEGTSRGLEQQSQQQQAEIDTRRMEELQQHMMQVRARRRQQMRQFVQLRRQQEMMQIAAPQMQQLEQQEPPMMFQQKPWFENIMNPPKPQTMDFMEPLLPLPPGLFGDHNTAAAMLHSHFRE